MAQVRRTYHLPHDCVRSYALETGRHRVAGDGRFKNSQPLRDLRVSVVDVFGGAICFTTEALSIRRKRRG